MSTKQANSSGSDNGSTAAESTVREKLAQLSRYMLALVTGTVVLFPSINDSLKPPYIWNFALYGFWVSAILAIVLLGFSYYLSNFVASKVPHRSIGLGNWAALASLVFLVLYVGGNLYSDRSAPLQVESVTVEPREARPGDWVQLSAESNIAEAEDLKWRWTVRSRPAGPEAVIGKSKTTYWRAPFKKGSHSIRVSVEDVRGERAQQTLEILVGDEQAMNGTSSTDDAALRTYVQDKISLALARIAREDPGKSSVLAEARGPLLELALENIGSLEAISQEPNALDEAVKAYFSIPLEKIRKARFRPCCSEYPGIWPLCNKSC